MCDFHWRHGTTPWDRQTSAMLSSAAQPLEGKQITISAFKAFVDTVALPAYEKLFSGLPDHSINVSRREDYLRRVKDVNKAAGEFIEGKIFPRIRYITASELLRALAEMAVQLREYYDRSGKKVALVVTAGKGVGPIIWEKSNIMLAILLASHLHPSAVLVEPCFHTDSMIEACTSADYEYLVVDDCMYTGSQMRATLQIIKSRGWKGTAYAVVPFAHTVQAFIRDKYFHPAIVDQVKINSKPLSIITLADEDQAAELGLIIEGKALTYLQTKMPDDLSVTAWMLHGGNPFLKDSPQFRMFNQTVPEAKYNTLINGCESQNDCPKAMYKELQAGFGTCARLHLGGAKRRARSKASKSRKRSVSARRRRQRRG